MYFVKLKKFCDIPLEQCLLGGTAVPPCRGAENFQPVIEQVRYK